MFASKGLSVPDTPAWQEVADLAAKVDGAQPWDEGDLSAWPARLGRGHGPAQHRREHLGGIWFTKDRRASLNSPQRTDATNFYVNLPVETYPQALEQFAVGLGRKIQVLPWRISAPGT